ncbi:hypothetical protein D3C86_1325300 [compost metagenome]
MDVGAQVALGRHAAKGGIFAVTHQRPAIHHEEADITILRSRQIGLRDQITLKADRFENLVEIGLLAGADLEDVLAAGTLQRLDDDALGVAIGKGAYFIDIARDDRGGADDFRKALEIELVLRQRQAFGIIQHHDAALFCKPPEQDAGMHRPRPRRLVERGVVAQHQRIDFLYIHCPPLQRLVLKGGMEAFRFLVFCLRQYGGMDGQAVIRAQGKIPWCQIDHLMAAIECRHGKQAGRVVRPLGFDGIDEKCDTHEAPPIKSPVRQWIIPPVFFPAAHWPWRAAEMRVGHPADEAGRAGRAPA